MHIFNGIRSLGKKCQKKRQNIKVNVKSSFPQLSCFDKYLLGYHLLENHDFTKWKKNLEHKIYSPYGWSKLLFSHISLNSAFVSQRPWYLPLDLSFYYSYWKYDNYCEILKLQGGQNLGAGYTVSPHLP
jgi:hypothetical protein